MLPILHGPFGEDGTVQGLCELAGVAYVGPGVLASSVCMDKDVFKTLMRGAGVPVARHVALRLGDPVENPFGYPVFVKPANMGSSVGISKVREEAELEAAVELARRHDEKVMIEEFVDGTEVEVGVLGNLPRPIASLPGEVIAHNSDWYDYSSKYDEGGSELVVPPPGLTEAQIERARELALSAFVATSCEGMARADFFVRASDGEVLMNELNTIPGFTSTSFYARLFAASGIAYGELLDRPYVAPFHGNITDICPVGALTNYTYRFRARPWDVEQAGSVCTLCPSQCNVSFTVRDEKVKRVLTRDNAEVDDGWLCDRGRYGFEMFDAEERITGPRLQGGAVVGAGGRGGGRRGCARPAHGGGARRRRLQRGGLPGPAAAARGARLPTSTRAPRAGAGREAIVRLAQPGSRPRCGTSTTPA